MDIRISPAEQDRYLEGCSSERIQRLCARTARSLGVDLDDMDQVDMDEGNAAWDEIVSQMWLADELARLAERGVLSVGGVGEDGRLRYRLHPDLAAE